MVELEPFLKCEVVKTHTAKYPRSILIRVLVDKSVTKSNKVEMEFLEVWVGPYDLLGNGLCGVYVINHEPGCKLVLIELPNIPEGEQDRKFWVFREQIEWH